VLYHFAIHIVWIYCKPVSGCTIIIPRILATIMIIFPCFWSYSNISLTQSCQGEWSWIQFFFNIYDNFIIWLTRQSFSLMIVQAMPNYETDGHLRLRERLTYWLIARVNFRPEDCRTQDLYLLLRLHLLFENNCVQRISRERQQTRR